MRYLGGKASKARLMADVMLFGAADKVCYIEPFLGSGAVLEFMAPGFERVYAGDAMVGLVQMWRCLIDGWQPTPKIDEHEYTAARNGPDSPQRTLIGFGASFAGKWFAGYARPHASQPDPYGTSARVAVRRARAFAHAELVQTDYKDWDVGPGDVVYCDPPYKGGAAYATGGFDTDEFWSVCAEWATSGAVVFVSEYRAPNHAQCVLEMPRQSRVRKNGADRVVDRLYLVKGAP